MSDFLIENGVLKNYTGQASEVVIPDEVKEIGTGAFALAGKRITSIKLPDGLEKIGREAFRGCRKLREIFIPAGVTIIGYDIFRECEALERIDVDANNKVYASFDGVLYEDNGKRLLICPPLKKIISIPAEVKEISYSAVPVGTTKVIEGLGLFERDRTSDMAEIVDVSALTAAQCAAILLNQKTKAWIALAVEGMKKIGAQPVFDIVEQMLEQKEKLPNVLAKNMTEVFVAHLFTLSEDSRKKLYELLCAKSPAAKELLEKSNCGEMLGQGGAEQKWVIENEKIIGINGSHARIDLPDGIPVAENALAQAQAEVVCIHAKNKVIDLAWLEKARLSAAVKRLEVSPNWLTGLIHRTVGFKEVIRYDNSKCRRIILSEDVKSRMVFMPETVKMNYDPMTRLAVRDFGMDIHDVLEIFCEKMDISTRIYFLTPQFEETMQAVSLPRTIDAGAYDVIAAQLADNRTVPVLARMVFGKRMDSICFEGTQQKAPALAVEFLVLFFMLYGKRDEAVGCRPMQLLDLLDKKQIQDFLQENFDIEDNGTSTGDSSRALPSVCRLCGLKQAVHLNALYNQYKRKSLMEGGSRSLIRNAIETYLPFNENSDVLLALDKHKNGLFGNAAKLRGMTEDELRDELQNFAEDMLDSSGQMTLDYGARTFVVTLLPDMTVTIWDEEKGKNCNTLPKAGKMDDAQKAAQAAQNLKQLKNNVKNLSAARAKSVQDMLQSGETMPAKQWKNRYVKSNMVRTLASGILWGVYEENDTLLRPFAVDANARCLDLNGAEICLADDDRIGVVDAAQLTDEDLEAWRVFFWKKGTKAVVRQFEAPARYVSSRFVPRRYMDLTFGMGYACNVLGYNPYSDGDATIVGNYLRVIATPCERGLVGEDKMKVYHAQIEKPLPAFSAMTDHQKRLFNRDLIRLDSVLHPQKKAEEAVASGSQEEIGILADMRLITPDNITQMLGIAMDKKNTDAVSYLMQLKQDWLGDVSDPFAEFTLDD